MQGLYCCPPVSLVKIAMLQLTKKCCFQGQAGIVKKKNKAKVSWLLLKQELGCGTGVPMSAKRKKEQNWWGERDHFKSLRGYCKQWRKKEKNGTIKQYLAASFAKQTYFHEVFPITATSFNGLYLSESKKHFLIVRGRTMLLCTLIGIPVLSPTSTTHSSPFPVRERNPFPQATKPEAGLHHHSSLDSISCFCCVES